MSQYHSRLCISYADGKLSWLKVRGGFEKVNVEKIGFEAGSRSVLFEPKRSTDRVVLDDFSCSDEELQKLVTELSKKIKTQGIIIADTTDYNVNPYVAGFYSAGDGVKSFYYDENDPLCELQEMIEISNVEEWFEKAVRTVTDKENKRIKKCGYKPKLDINEGEESGAKSSKSVAMIYAAFPDKETANAAFGKWIVFREADGSEHSVLDPKGARLGSFEADKRRFLFGEIPGMDEQQCKEYLEVKADVFAMGCSMGIVWNGIDPKIDIVYSFGDGIKERHIEAPDLKEKKRDGLSLDESIRCSDIPLLFGDDLSGLETVELQRLKECELI